jgi:hypothetical protein
MTPGEVALPSTATSLTVKASGGVHLALSAEPTQPLTLRFTLPPSVATNVVAVHIADDGTVDVLPSTLVDGALVVTTDHFTFVGWMSAVWNFLSGSTPPNVCSSAPPSWANLLGHPSSVHACMSTNLDPTTGNVRAELDIKSNRGTWQELLLPPEPKDYVFGQDQPQWAIDLYRLVLNEGTNFMLLPPGGRVTMGFLRPQSAESPAVTVSPPDGWLYALTWVSTILKFAGVPDGKSTWVTAVLIGSKCLGAGVLQAPKTPLNGGLDTIAVARCVVDGLIELGRSPSAWIATLPTSFKNAITPAIRADINDASAGLGKAAFTLSLLSTYAFLMYQLRDLIVGAVSPLADSQVLVSLDPPAAPRPTPPPVTPPPVTSNGVNVALPAGGAGPLTIAFHAGLIYVADFTSSTLTVVDPTTNASRNYGPVAGGVGPVGMAFDANRVYIVNQTSSTVSVGDIATASLVGVFGPAPGASLTGIAFDGTNVWISSAAYTPSTSAPDGTIIRGNVTTAASTTFTFPDGGGACGVAFDGTYIWTANNDTSTVTRINPADGSATTFPLPGALNPCWIVFDGTHLWTANRQTNDLSEIDPSTGASTIVPLPPGTRNPEGITFDGTNIWTTNYLSDNLSKVNVATHVAVNVPLPAGASGPSGVAFDGHYIWTSNFTSNNLSKITP